jgi:hypothetical protein
MDSLDKFFKKYSYKFPKGYPDLNDEQDINLLADILENMGINLKEEQQLDIDFPEDSLEGKLKSKKLNPEWINYIDLIATSKKHDVEKELLDYLNSDNVLSLKDLQTNNNLFSLIKSKTNLNDDFIKKILNYKPQVIGRSVGIGEIALALFFNGIKKGKGDIEIDGKLIEIKGNNSRFAVEGNIPKGRSGEISEFYKNLKTKYPEAAYSTNLNQYLKNIFETYPNSEEEINKELNTIYPASAYVEITKDNLKENSLLIKYVSNYINTYPENIYYMLISSNFDYKLYTPSELLDKVETGEIKFASTSGTGISPSTAYPNLKLN